MSHLENIPETKELNEEEIISLLEKDQSSIFTLGFPKADWDEKSLVFKSWTELNRKAYQLHPEITNFIIDRRNGRLDISLEEFNNRVNDFHKKIDELKEEVRKFKETFYGITE